MSGKIKKTALPVEHGYGLLFTVQFQLFEPGIVTFRGSGQGFDLAP